MNDLIGAQEHAVVLCIDSDADFRLQVRKSLESAGLEFMAAGNRESAITAFTTKVPDIVILDTITPGVDGLQICTTIRNLPGGQYVPILVVTGIQNSQMAIQAYHAGATDIASKPLNYEILAHRLSCMLRSIRTANYLREREAHLTCAQKIANLGSWELDLASREFAYSDQLCTILGWAPGKSPIRYTDLLEAIHSSDRTAVKQGLHRVMEQGGCCQNDYRIVQPAGVELDVQQHAQVITDASGKALKLAGVVQIIVPRRSAETSATGPAFHDSVTGLPNRLQMSDLLRNSIANAKRHDRVVTVMFVDLDHFRRINDTWGHSVGDELLSNVATRLNECLRAGDSVARQVSEVPEGALEAVDEPILGRLEGDEFVILLYEIRRVEDAAIVARRIIDGLAAPFMVKDTEVYITASIGISGFPTDGTDCETLLRRASAAMCQAKETGRNGYHFFTEDNNVRALRRLNIEADLRRALENGDFLLHYQPKVETTTGRVCGMEALVRWNDPVRGLISPAEFIPIAEDTRLIVPLGEWILKTACAQTRTWHDMGLGPLSISVNISAVQFHQGAFINTVSKVLAWTELDPRYLELELTESLLVDNADASIRLMHELRHLGLELSIDDFGTGYSSLSYLKRFPINVLKIDRAFILEIGTDPDDAAIVRAIVGLAHSLGLSVVAEGVEEQAQFEFLRECGCDQIQGYYFSRPLPGDEFSQWVMAQGHQGLKATG